MPALYRRAWILAMLDCAEKFGVTPLSRDELHTLAFLGDALAPVYELTAPDKSVLKSADGPFFPAVQWDVDRLAAQGLIDREVAGDATGEATYSCSASGQAVARRLSGSPLVDEATGYLHELIAAFGSIGVGERSSISRADATYASRETPGTVLDFGDWEQPSERNYSFRTTRSFESLNARGSPFSPRERMHLYVRYLIRAREAQQADAS